MKDLLGTTDVGSFMTLLFFAIVGMIISLLLHGANREPTEPTTPEKFSLSFLFLDNWKRILLNVLVLFAAVRFYPDIFNEPINPFLSFGIGLGFDKVVQMIKDRMGVLQVSRRSIATTEEKKEIDSPKAT